MDKVISSKDSVKSSKGMAPPSRNPRGEVMKHRTNVAGEWRIKDQVIVSNMLHEIISIDDECAELLNLLNGIKISIKKGSFKNVTEIERAAGRK